MTKTLEQEEREEANRMKQRALRQYNPVLMSAAIALFRKLGMEQEAERCEMILATWSDA